MKKLITLFLPEIVKSYLRIIVNKIILSKCNKNVCNTKNLRVVDNNLCQVIFSNSEINDDWENKMQNNSSFLNLPDNNHGINKGDQRAIYYLIKGIKIKSVLEIGTHIGVSTYYFSNALKDVTKDYNIVTVDIIDVNDINNKHWENFGATSSPLSRLESGGLANNVKFIKSDSVDYMKRCKQKFDLIFLDGSHQANVVYNEMPCALNLLNPNGIILLHDFYPNNKPLWDNNVILPGPYLAMHRYNNEGVNFKTIPLGDLPWETKNNSSSSSLAIVSKTD